MNIMAQIFGTIAVMLMFLSYQKKSKKGFLKVQIFSNIFFGLQYFVLNAISALSSNIISAIRTIIFYKYEKSEKRIPISFLIIFEIIIILLGIYSYNGLYSIIPVFIAGLYTYGTWQEKINTTYIIGIIASILWIYYNSLVGAYVAIIGSVIELIGSALGLIKLKTGKKY